MIKKTKVELLVDKGVKIPVPESVFVDDDVDLSRVAGENVIFYPGTRIMGKDTLIMPNSVLGFEAPVTLDNVFAGAGTRLNGGFFQKCVFAGRNTFGSGGHVRVGTILEEESSAAHTVGLKQTILFPFVTLGSLINFCDCLMAGGTSRKDHSEVGSSFIHFNYTPNQDKATPSMLGNVYQGVMLKNRPVFLGGQGGLVGPCRLPFGSVTAAGTIWRKDITEPDRLLFGGGIREAVLTRREGVYTNVKRVFENNLLYIGGLVGLMNWYIYIRSLFVSDFFSQQLLIGMKQALCYGIDERVRRIDDFVKRLCASRELVLSKNGGKITPVVEEHNDIIQKWSSLFEVIKKIMSVIMENVDEPVSIRSSSSLLCNDDLCSAVESASEFHRLFFPAPPRSFLLAIESGISEHGFDYINVIKSLDDSISAAGSRWLESIENNLLSKAEFL